MTLAERKNFQRDLNAFTTRWLRGVKPLTVDGKLGFLTNRRVRTVEWYLGYAADRIKELGDSYRNDKKVRRELVRRLRHPLETEYVPAAAKSVRKAVVQRGRARRRKHNREFIKNQVQGFFASGVAYYDGRPVAKWMVPYLNYARAHGWQGRVNSGWRNPVYSEQLCYSMCGAPSCPGRCAGRASNHAGSKNPQGALDVSDYFTFGKIMASMPLPAGAPRLYNALGSRDPVHFSASGR